MKIFAKRKKTIGAANPGTPTARTTFASDPVVEELLTKDPTEWNAKQKRLVKRYQQRKAESGEGSDAQKEQQEPPVKKESKAEETAEESVEQEADEKSENDEVSKKESDDDSSSSDSGGDSDSESNSDSDPEVEGKKDEEAAIVPREEPVAETAVEETQTPPSTAEAETGSDKIDTSHPVFKLLEQLNSKMKRTLSRKLDREGPKALPEVEQEAQKLLGVTDEQSKKRGAGAIEGKDSGKSKKKKTKIDWSSLPPEERLRRQEQRKKQQQAAERRATGEETRGPHKHPLNSERRRANRRKPKWKNTFKREEKKNHHASGFLVRREAGGPRVNEGY
ncbi:MAG: hypothetical protein SGBAC_007344 [Bacillariaceae sp.]